MASSKTTNALINALADSAFHEIAVSASIYIDCVSENKLDGAAAAKRKATRHIRTRMRKLVKAMKDTATDE